MTKHEAIEVLEEVKMLDDSLFAYSQAYNDALDMAIEALKAQEPVVQQWVNTKDRLPADRGRYLVMLKTDGKIGFEVHEHLMRILWFGSEGWRLPRHYPEWIHEALKQEVTHWMLLPEPPKEG